MINVEFCICCNGKNLEIFPAYMHRFVVDRMTGSITNNPLIECKYLHCLDCGYAGSDLRFDNTEEARYYRNYMKEEYIVHRCNYEGYGLRPILEFLSTAEYQEMRKLSTAMTLKEFIDLSKIESVLDFGGDTGELIPDELLHAKRYVTDLESRIVDNGVTLVRDPSESGLVDLVICSHTLEHVSDPMAVIADMKRYLKKDGWICIEIPRERDGNYEPGHQFHEHINHFTFDCLEYMLEENGFKNLSGVVLEYEKHVGTAYVVTGQLK